MRLNIVMSYPVKWSIYKVMRDYIQNFFDAVGPTRFKSAFHYKYENQTLIMYADESFDKEWLFYIGTSTKRDSTTKYAGKFGEGFKIASLVAYRDYKLNIIMESQDWKLKVTEEEGEIDQKEVMFLAYDVSSRTYEQNAILTLEGVNEEVFHAFEYEIKQFFYDGNPRFGKCIAKGEDFAVYHSKQTTSSKNTYGYLYAAFQQRKSFLLPIIICNHTYTPKRDDRDREKFYSSEVLECIFEVIRKVQPCEAMEMLESLYRCWHGRSEKEKYINVRYIVIELIQQICIDDIVKDRFFERYKENLVADFSWRTTKNRKKMAKLWFRTSEYHGKRRVVINEFTKLGIIDMEQLCENNHGFQVYREPTAKECRYITILEKAAKEIMSDIISYDSMPTCQIIINSEAVLEGCAITTKAEGQRKNQVGLQVKTNIFNVYLQRYLFEENRFGQAFSVYMHELLHQYGGDNSVQFHNALLLMNKRIIVSSNLLDEFEQRWRQVK